MKRLTRKNVKVEPIRNYENVNIRGISDRFLTYVLNGPTLHGASKDFLRSLVRQLYAALQEREDAEERLNACETERNGRRKVMRCQKCDHYAVCMIRDIITDADRDACPHFKGWVSVKERLPKIDQEYRRRNGEWPTFIVMLRYGRIATTGMYSDEGWIFDDGNDYVVTHWQPLPIPTPKIQEVQDDAEK